MYKAADVIRRKPHIMKNKLLAITAVCLAACTTAIFANNSGFHVIGWQDFDTVIPGDNNSGIGDVSPDTNSTFDATPTGTHADRRCPEVPVKIQTDQI